MEMGSSAVSTRFHQPHMERKMSAMTCEIFNELRLEGKLCDVVIKVNGFEFNAHKNILCSCSSYFRALFTSGWNNTEKKVYNIPGISPDMMKLIIEYAYTRTVPITPDNVEKLLAAADQFNIMGIVRGCCEFLKSELCLDNCIGICKFTDYYYCPELRQKAYMFILHNFEEMVKVSAEFLELSVTELKDIIEKDELNVKQEDAVFEAILKWISHDPQNRKQHISVLLPKVRLALMHAEYFMNNVKMNDYVKDSEECKPVIINALKAMYDLNMNGPSNSDFTNPLTRPRLPYAILFAIGGWSGGSPTNAIEAYDARADRWVNVTCEEESPRAYHGAAYLKGYVYIIGGFDSVDYFNSVKRFDPVRKTWHQVAPMHSRRCYVSVTVLSNFIYAMGGFDGYVRLNTAERYEPETNQWTLIAPMHEQRSDASATTLYGKVYICGGFNGNECLFTAEVYNTESNQWTVIAPMRSRRSGIGVIAYGEHVYAVGGFDGANRLRSAEAYSPVANTWRTIPTMFNPRSNFGIEVVDDLLFVVGGFNGFTTTFNVECYDEKTDEWYDAHDMSIYRSALSCCVVPGLANVGEYAARRDNFTGLALRDEVKYSASTSTLPV
ncbi:kelch-like protein 10 [Tenrec ecaudatus]|uniref:kelch-like protein 10 n=1 Tax=Tenrec ecaudatus TaxID=94439 RepID=UPI003F5AC1B7